MLPVGVHASIGVINATRSGAITAARCGATIVSSGATDMDFTAARRITPDGVGNHTKAVVGVGKLARGAQGGIVAAVCTVVVMVRPGHPWPLLLAANRDERTDRAWDPPGAHWPDRPGTIGGRDRLGNGSWMACRGGVFAAVLNRPGSLGPQAGKLSRGVLPLDALESPSAAAAAEDLARLDAGQYRTFNVIVADAEGAWFARGRGAGRPEVRGLDPGLHMITAHDPNDPASARTRAHLPRFQSASPPDPGAGSWQDWMNCLQDRSGPRGAAINVPSEQGFGTVCASLAAVSSDRRPVWLFAAGPPDEAPFRPVSLP